MKRKLFTLLVALLAVVGFQAKAQTACNADGKYYVMTGDTLTSWTPGTWINPSFFTNERGGYAGKVTVTPYKLVSNGTNLYVDFSAPKGSADWVAINNLAPNYTSFTASDGVQLKLPYNSVTYDRFVVFTNLGSPSTTKGGIRTYYEGGDPNHGFSTNQVEWNVSPSVFTNGSLEGFLAVQAGGSTTDPNLLIVVHNEKGILKLMTYGDYLNTIDATSGSASTLLPKKGSDIWYPLYVKVGKPAGHWATPADFANCKFHQFMYNGAPLQVQDGQFLQNLSSDATQHSTFTVKQVDYVKNQDYYPAYGTSPLPSNSNETNNIFTYTGGATFQGINGSTSPITNSNSWYGTTDKNPATPSHADSVIPLFIFASPDDACKILSVSRQNDLKILSQSNGAYANKLELRDFASYYWWDTAKSTWVLGSKPVGNEGTDIDQVYDTYTSLQKFAVWVDECGNMTLYPAASYYWDYGTEKKAQVDKILPNAVLKYNDINVYNANPLVPTDKDNGCKIGWWNGKLTDGTNVGSTICTAPNNLDVTWKDYETRPFVPGCISNPQDITGRFFFLQVMNPSAPTTGDFAANGYQYNREYVLSTQVNSDGNKILVVVPKEKMMADISLSKDYWRFPYDSVNMAAHWEIQPVNGGYRFINELGDTLTYDYIAADNLLYGGYLPVNSVIAGANDGVNEGIKYFGRPTHTGNYWSDVTHWFALNPKVDSLTLGVSASDVWKVNQYDASGFFLELAAPQYQGTIDMVANGDWYKTVNTIGSGPSRTYWQKDVALEMTSNTGLITTSGTVSTCLGGLMLAVKEIEYVPKYGPPFYPGEPQDNIINTTSWGATSNNQKDVYMKSDSLSAYTFLQCNYDLTEANAVDNALKLSYMTVSVNGSKVNLSTGVSVTTTDAARLVSSTGENVLKFIPLNSDSGKLRASNISNATLATGQSPYDPGLDTLYNETYKWVLVKNTQNNKYLVFDTVNVAASTNREKVGFTFDADVTNATPVRLYQPLVGDKAGNNFLFQFYMPKYRYYQIAGTWYAGENIFPDIENKDLSTTVPGGGEVCFASLNSQSNYIFAARTYTGLQSGTRFTIVNRNNPQPCDCIGEFLTPQWMAQNRLLSLPLYNQIWFGNAPANAWIATASDNMAIVENVDAASATTLNHVYQATIRNGQVTLPNSANHTIYNFQKDTIVPLYYIKNADGNYLTVVPAQTDMQDDRATIDDVNGVKLQWLPKFDNTDFATLGYDKSALQLFAISGCQEGQPDANNWYGKYVYLPLASYVVNYKTGSCIKNDGTIVPNDTVRGYKDQYIIRYNLNLGKQMSPAVASDDCLNTNPSGCSGNDITSCYRISQYTKVDGTVKYLVVFNAKSQVAAGSLVPIEVKWQKQPFIHAGCTDYQLVKTTDGYWTVDGKQIADANENSLNAHWKLNWNPNGDDKDLVRFEAELQKVYEQPYTQVGLTGDYYFLKAVTETNGDITVNAIDVTGYGSDSNFDPKPVTFTFTCINHDLPFYDLVDDGGFDLSQKLAILEIPWADRNLGIVASKGTITADTDKVTGRVIRYQCYINQVMNGFGDEKIQYLNVYPELRRVLAGVDKPGQGHVIPYYSFSLTKYDPKVGKDVEYFLNVKPGADVSVAWDTITPDMDNALKNPTEANKWTNKYYKFCLPYKWEQAENGTWQHVMIPVVGSADPYPALYIQSLDNGADITGKTDYPYLICASTVTERTSALRLSDAVLPGYGLGGANNMLTLNIYSVDYRFMDPKADAWIFGGAQANLNEWVPIADLVTKTPGDAASVKEGTLTDFKLVTPDNGVLYVWESQKTPVNYGYMNGANDAGNVTLYYGGTSVIGSPLRPIWYYRINLGNGWLTDATGTTDPNYIAPGTTSPYAWFSTNKLPDETTYTADKIYADKEFKQTFGFKYVDNETDPDQRFYIVSNANYTTPKAGAYRYVMSINNQLVFTSNKDLALVFQWGKLDGSNYTNLEVVGQGNIYGVNGGVKFLNVSGKADIYSIDGRLIKSVVLTGSNQVVDAPRGIAIVKNGSNVVKVVVQ